MTEAYDLKNNVRKLRFEKDEMTQQQLADVAGVTRQTIIAIEQGKYAPSLPLAFKIARAFGVGIDHVFEYTEIDPPNKPIITPEKAV